MRRLLAILVLALMMVPAAMVLVPSAEAQSPDIAIAAEPQIADSHGISLSLMTDSDMLGMKAKVGTRIEGVNYDVIVDGHHTGLAPPSSETWESMVGTAWIAQAPAGLELSAPASYDMSANSWFPKVGNQGSQGSCAAWAATYYCYGAVEAKDNGWTLAKSGNTAQLLSPAWTYNRVAYRGLGGGSWMSENFYVVKDWGVSTLSTFPYVDTNAINWGAPAAWREAPLHRGSQLVFLSVNANTIDSIKTLVTADQPITFAIDADQFGPSLSDDNIISADEYVLGGSLNHAQTIVGFNDTKVADGHPDVGAFRVVNSWGSGWGDGGYYWISYDAFDKIMNVNGNELCYITDIPNYEPSLLAIWHYNNPPKRDVEHILNIGSPSILDSKTPYFVSDSSNVLPTFMVCDISEFRSYYDSGATKFNLEVDGGVPSVISSFRIESYDTGYSPGAPTQASAQSGQVPKATPGNLNNFFADYSPISPAQALDRTGIEIASPDLADWVGVSQPSVFGDGAMQAGDSGDSCKSSMQISVTGFAGISFYWKVSSEQSNDFLRFYESSTKNFEISGDGGWHQVWYYFTSPGTHVLKWSYEKSSSISSLQDSAWVDHLQLLDSAENDSSPPTTAINCVGDIGTNGWYKSSVNTALVANDSGSGVNSTKYRLDSSLWRDYVGSFIVSGNGEHLLEYYSTDYAGNVEAVKSSTLKIDTIDPVVWSSHDGVEGSSGWYISEVGINITATDGTSGISSVMFSLDGSESQAYTGVITVSAQGTHTLSYHAVDNAGNVGGDQSISFKIDTVSPIISCVLDGVRGNGTWFVSAVETSIAGLDATSSLALLEYRLDNGSWQNYSSALLVQGDGEHSVEYRATDVAGNIGIARASNFRIDSIAPQSLATINGSVGTQGWYNGSVKLTIFATDSTSGVSRTCIRVNDGNWSIGNNLTFINGIYRIEFYSIDGAGNTGPIENVTIKSDIDNPFTDILVTESPSESGWFTSNVSLELSAIDGVSGVKLTEYRLDGGDWILYDGTINFGSDGTTLVEYRSTDLAGNQEHIRSLEVNVDKDAPTSTIQVQGEIGAGGWYASSLLISISASDTASGVGSIEFCLDSGNWLTYENQIVIDSNGTHILQFHATDQAGNIEPIEEISFDIDRDLPTLSTQIDGLVFTTNQVSLNWTSSDSTSGVGAIELSLDGGAYQVFGGTQNNITFQGLDDGQHSLLIRAIDYAGNEVIKEMSFKVDTNPLSPQGPYGLTLLVVLIGVIALIAFLFILKARRH